MILSQALSAALAAALAWGAVGEWRIARMKAAHATEREQQARAQTEYVSRNYVSRSVAEAQYQALAGSSAKVLREVTRVPAEPLKCPPDADVRDVLIPGIADRLRVIRDASGLPTRPDVGAVQSGAAATADDRTGY